MINEHVIMQMTVILFLVQDFEYCKEKKRIIEGSIYNRFEKLIARIPARIENWMYPLKCNIEPN